MYVAYIVESVRYLHVHIPSEHVPTYVGDDKIPFHSQFPTYLQSHSFHLGPGSRCDLLAHANTHHEITVTLCSLGKHSGTMEQIS